MFQLLFQCKDDKTLIPLLDDNKLCDYYDYLNKKFQEKLKLYNEKIAKEELKSQSWEIIIYKDELLKLKSIRIVFCIKRC